MKQLLSGTAIALALLVFNSAASAQHNSGHYYNGGQYSQHHVQPQYSQNGYGPNQYIQRPNFGGSFGYTTPSFGFGINYGQGYGSNIYTQPGYVPNYYQGQPSNSWHGQPHHRYGHR